MGRLRFHYACALRSGLGSNVAKHLPRYMGVLDLGMACLRRNETHAMDSDGTFGRHITGDLLYGCGGGVMWWVPCMQRGCHAAGTGNSVYDPGDLSFTFGLVGPQT